MRNSSYNYNNNNYYYLLLLFFVFLLLFSYSYSYYYYDDDAVDAGTTVYARAPYLDPDTQAAAAATSAKGTNSAESGTRPQYPPVPASLPTVMKRASGSGRHAAAGKRSSTYHQTSVAGLESPEAAAAADMKDPSPVFERPAMSEKAGGRGNGTATSVPVHGRPSGSGIDMTRQLAKRTEAFEQLSALLQ